RLKTASLASRFFAVRGDVEDDADRRKRRKEGRTPMGDERKRQPGQGEHSEHGSDVQKGRKHDHKGKAGGDIGPGGGARFRGDAESAGGEGCKYDKQSYRPYE